jgi:hypothetical protein
LDGQPVMAMFRRSPRSPSPFRRRQEELDRREAELRDQCNKLERMIANARRATEETSRPVREKANTKTNPGDDQLHVSVALQDKRYFDDNDGTPKRRSLRKERREGRIMFLMLVVALAGAVIWLVSHLHF